MAHQALASKHFLLTEKSMEEVPQWPRTGFLSWSARVALMGGRGLHYLPTKDFSGQIGNKSGLQVLEQSTCPHRQDFKKNRVFILYNSFQLALHLGLEVLQMRVCFLNGTFKKIKQKCTQTCSKRNVKTTLPASTCKFMILGYISVMLSSERSFSFHLWLSK